MTSSNSKTSESWEEEIERVRRTRFGKEMRKWFLFDERYLNLNHGSFGTYPLPVRTAMRHFQDSVEARPDDFIRYQYAKLLDEARCGVSKVLNAPVETIVFVPNATTGINTVLRNLVFEEKEYILYFATIYGACEKSVTYITETTPAEAVKVDYTYPVEDEFLLSEFHRKVDEVEKSGGKVKIAIFDTVVSMPGLRMPFEDLTKACKQRGVLSCIDGAHGVGHVELDLSALDPDFFVSNMHKWLFVPRGAAMFYVPLRNQSLMRSTLPTSHGFTPFPKAGVKIHNPFPLTDKSQFLVNFEFVGTIDNAPYLCVDAALRFREAVGGEQKILSYCQDLAKRAAYRAAEMLGTEVLQNKSETLMNCCLTNVRLPLDFSKVASVAAKEGVKKDEVGTAVRDWMTRAMVDEYHTFMALIFYGGNWWVRFSGQIYLELSDFEWAARTLKELCERAEQGEFAKVMAREKSKL